MRIKILIGAAMLLGLVASAVAADVTGKWVAQIPGMDGATNETTFVFKVDGTTLTGTMTNPQGETQITDGKVDGDKISFVVVRKRGEMEMKLTWKGQVSGDEIKFTREFAMPPGGFGGPGGGGPGAGGPPAGGPGGGPGGGFTPPPIIAKRAK